jgi:hypothetical protein
MLENKKIIGNILITIGQMLNVEGFNFANDKEKIKIALEELNTNPYSKVHGIIECSILIRDAFSEFIIKNQIQNEKK